MKNRVLLIGVDTSKFLNSNIPGYDPAEIHRQSVISKDTLNEMGYEAKWCYLDITSDNPSQKLEEELTENQYDCILIGAGLRKRTDQYLLLEKLLNIVHHYAIGTKICLNGEVTDTIDAVKRQLILN